MAGSITVTPEELRNSAGKMDQDISKYVNLYKQLQSEIESMKKNWSGEANQDYVRRIEGFYPEFENLKKVLDGYSEFLKEAARVYAETESNIKDGTSKLTSGR